MPFRGFGPRASLFWAGLVLAFGVWLVPDGASAQREDLLTDQACRNDPNSEACICRDVFVYRLVPANIDYSTFPPQAGFRMDGNNRVDQVEIEGLGMVRRASGSSAPPVWNDELKRWDGDLVDMEVRPNTAFDSYCSLEYFRENLRRLVYVAMAVGGLLFALSVGWAGFVHMQETASGAAQSSARNIILRTFIGMILLASVFVVWEGVSGLFLGGVDIWDTDPRLFEFF